MSGCSGYTNMLEEQQTAKLVDVVVNTAIAMNLHPYDVIRRLTFIIPDGQRDNLRAELVKRAHTLPWKF